MPQNFRDNTARAGLNTDNVIGQIQEGYITYALNAVNDKVTVYA